MHRYEILAIARVGRITRLSSRGRAQQESGTTKEEPVLINNVWVYSGIEDQLTSENVLVADRKIKQISRAHPPAAQQHDDRRARTGVDAL